MTAQGPSLIESVKQLQEHRLDYGQKCRNACYSGAAAAWALLASGNLSSSFFFASCACFLGSLALDISISNEGAKVLIKKITEAQERGDKNIDYTAKEAVAFSKHGDALKWLVYGGFLLIAAGYAIALSHSHPVACQR